MPVSEPLLRDDSLDESLHATQRQLSEANEQRAQLEKLQAELSLMVDRQNRFLHGREKLREELRRALTRLESEGYQLQRRSRLVSEMHKLIEPYPEALESMRPEYWNREQLDQDLLDALAAVEQMEQDVKKAGAALGWEQPGAESAAEGRPGSEFRTWFWRGLGFTLPLVAVLLIILVFQLVFGGA